METPHRIIVERLLQERRSDAAAERLARQARQAARPDGHARAVSRPGTGTREIRPGPASARPGMILGPDGGAAVDGCGLPQRAG